METQRNEIPTNWVSTNIGEICSQPQYGYTTKATDTGDLLLLRTTDITSGKINWETVPYCSVNPADKEKYLLKTGDIVVSRAGSVGVSYLVKEPKKSVFASYLIRFKPFIDHRYFKYFLESPAYWNAISEKRLGIAVPNVNANKLKSILIPVAPLNEQLRIVVKIEELFSELDNGVENLKTARGQLQVYRQALLKYAFEGKITARWRATNKGTLENPDHLIARIKKERNSDYEARISAWNAALDKHDGKPRPPKTVAPLDKQAFQELSMLPDSWIWEKLGWMTCGVEYGTAAKSLASGSIPVLRMGNIQNTKFDWSDLVYTSDEAEISKYSLRDGDVLFNRTNSPELVGKTAIYRGEHPALFAGYLIRVNQIPTILDSQYLNLFLNSHVARQHGNRVKTDGVNQSNINGEKLSNYPFPYCTLTEQREIVKILDEKLSVVDRLEEDIALEIEKAEALRQSILKKAFSGKLVALDPHDEPASILLERIRKEKAEKVNGKKKFKSRAAA